MKRHREAPEETAASDGGASTSMMALALFAGVVAGAAIARSWYLDEQARRHGERRDRIERWEGEGGALPGTVGTGGSANPRPSA